MATVKTHTQGVAQWVSTRDGRKLYAMTLPGPDTANALPTVVFEAGAGASRSTWGLVQPLVGKFARAVVYDRSGLGRSPADTQGRTLDKMADDLNDLLDSFYIPDKAGASTFILVGHSAGGSIVRLAASRKPDRIVGLVLVDPSDEASDSLFKPAFRRIERIAGVVGLALSHTGLLRLQFRKMRKKLPTDVQADFQREAFTPTAVRTASTQARTFVDELFPWRQNPPNIGDIPLTIISGGRKGGGITKTLRAEINAAHAYRVAQAAQGRHVIAHNSGHYVVITEPELIAKEIQRIIQGLK